MLDNDGDSGRLLPEAARADHNVACLSQVALRIRPKPLRASAATEVMFGAFMPLVNRNFCIELPVGTCMKDMELQP
jgi:hypothetical protein